MIDITKYASFISLYGGSEVKKTYYISGKKYMVKFPDPIRETRKNISYVNNQYSEYIGCKIFELFNIAVQNVSLVRCTIDDKEKIAVMCEDFLKDDEVLVEFKNLSYSLNLEKKYTNDLNDIFEMVNSVNNLEDKELFENNFWKIFIVDTLIGNVDRHLGNWALILKDNKYRLSPVYDCGSSLHPLLSEEEIIKILNTDELKNIAINLKTAYKLNGKTLNYIDIYNIMPNKLKEELINIYSLIDLNKIKDIIYSIDTLSNNMKEFYYKTILLRKENIIDKYYKIVARK